MRRLISQDMEFVVVCRALGKYQRFSGEGRACNQKPFINEFRLPGGEGFDCVIINFPPSKHHSMEVLVAILCDFAADYNGKLCITGAFDSIWAVRFPCVHPHCSVALRFLFREEDVGQHRLQLSMIDTDGRPVFPENGPSFDINVGAIPENTFFLSHNIVVNLQGLPLQRPGLYSLDVKIDDQIVARIPLQVVHAPQKNPGMGGR